LEKAAGNKTLPTAHGRAVERTPLPSPFAAQGRVTSCYQRPNNCDFRPRRRLPFTSRGHACAVERANGVHFARDALHRARANAALRATANMPLPPRNWLWIRVSVAGPPEVCPALRLA
jgi:hypothetical protein